MADFETAYYLTNEIEGGYANAPDDRGGETYRGIARKFHPAWQGWKIIDEVKKQTSDVKQINKMLENDSSIQQLIADFYLHEFWIEINGDLIPDQQIANEVYDNAVNMGVNTGSRYLQRTINILNRDQSKNFYDDIKADGDIGPATLDALKKCIRLNGVRRIVNVINGFQMKHYIEQMEKYPAQEKWVGWFDRVEVTWN
jgi:lysozyme family protein